MDNKTALLVMDVQPGIIERLQNSEEFLDKARTAIDAAHRQKIFVIFVVVGFRNGLPEISDNNLSFSQIKRTNQYSMIDTKPTIKLSSEDILVVKRRVSAFSGSDLEVILRAQNIQHLVLSGIATSGVVLSTLRQAADMDFQLSVLSDLCADFDDEINKVLLNKIFARQANVITANQWIEAISKSGIEKNL